MRWIWIPAAVLAAAAALISIERAGREFAPRAGKDDATGRAEACAERSPDDGPADASPGAEECAADYVVAGRIVDSSGRPVAGAAVHLRVGAG